MSTDLGEQEDELLALQSIFGSEEFVRDETKFAGKMQVSVELPADFSVVLKNGKTLRQYDISFLPPLQLTFELPEDYPSSSPPSFTLSCSWLTHTQLASLCAQLSDLYQSTGGGVVLFSWIQFLREDALKFLDIHSQLDLPSDERRTLHYKQDDKETEPPEAEGDENKSELTDQWEPSTSVSSTTDSRGASEPDFHKVDQNSLTSVPSHSSLNSKSETDHPMADKSRLLPFSQPDPDPEDLTKQEGAPLPVHPTDSSPNLDQTFSLLALSPSQVLLSQILIHDASQKQKAFLTTVFDCGVCYMGWLGSECVQLRECGHIFCRACLREFCKVRISEGNIRGVTCPQEGCTATPTPAQIKSLIGEDLFSKYDQLLLQSTLDNMPDVIYCPRPSCSLAVIYDKSSTAALCSVCSFAFCAVCRKTYHGANKCYEEEINEETEDVQWQPLPDSEEGLRALQDDFNSGSKTRRRLLENRYGRRVIRAPLQFKMSEKWISVNTKACPNCFSKIEKNGGCELMTCTRCGTQFIWFDR